MNYSCFKFCSLKIIYFQALGLVFTTSVEWSIFCFIDFFAFYFKRGKINKRKNTPFHARCENEPLQAIKNSCKQSLKTKQFCNQLLELFYLLFSCQRRFNKEKPQLVELTSTDRQIIQELRHQLQTDPHQKDTTKVLEAIADPEVSHN